MQSRIEILSAWPKAAAHGTSLLFVHGAFTASWCWREHFLDYFAAAGWSSHALSLSGHGGSRSSKPLDQLSIADYVADVAEVVTGLSGPVVLIGHSMGGFVVQKYLESQLRRDAGQNTIRGAILMASVPPQGLMAASLGLLLARPDLLTDLNRLMSGGTLGIDRLREALFAQPIDTEALQRYWHWAQPESHRALWDMSLDLPHPSRVLDHLSAERLKVIGGELDHLIPAALVYLTARSYHCTAKIHPGMGHGLMLERDWRLVADDLLDFLETL